MELTASFTELKLSANFTAETGQDILASHGLGHRPLVLDAKDLRKAELEQILPKLDEALAALKYVLPFPYPVYLLSPFARPHPPLQVIASRDELPTFYPNQTFIPTGKDMGLLARSKILQQRLRRTEPALWAALKDQQEQDELQREMELNTFYEQLSECLSH